MGVLSGRVRGRLLPPVASAVVLLLAIGAARVAAAPNHPGAHDPVASLQVFSRSPVLVRTGERVHIPVDVVCATRSGRACSASASIAVQQGASWAHAIAVAHPSVRFGVSRANWSGAVPFRIQATAGGRVVSAPSRRYYVTDDMPKVAVPPVAFGDVQQGTVALYLPWGSGPGQAGLVAGVEADTLGPSSFDVDRSGRIVLVDPALQKVSVYSNGRLVRDTRMPVGVRPDVAFSDDGSAYVASPPVANRGLVIVRSVDASGQPGKAIPLGNPDDMLSEVRVAGSEAAVRVYPEDMWYPAGGGSPTSGEPLGDGSQLLKVVDGSSVRLGTVVEGQVTNTVELDFSTSVGEIALARPDGSGGYWAVVHVSQDDPTPADQFQVVHVRSDLSVATFAAANQDYSDVVPMSKFRLGRDGNLYALQSSPDGIRIVRYDLGGVR
jgi:hypothetical protein